MRFTFIREHQGVYPVEVACEVLNVSRSGYYAWRDRPASAQAVRRQELLEAIQAVYTASHGTYGSPRIHRELQACEISCCRNTVARVMRENGVECRPKPAFTPQTTDSDHGYAVAENLLDQQFDIRELDTVWVSDITYIRTDEGWLYLAAVMDLCSRKIVGWKAADHLRSELACAALVKALKDRQPGSGLMHHSDQGVQYACDQYQQLLGLHGVLCSMSRRGNCYDNAPMESFFGSLKTEWVHHRHYRTRAEAVQSLFEYIEVFYNRQRRHSALGLVSPVDYEASVN
jgi:transposase InsO family protein